MLWLYHAQEESRARGREAPYGGQLSCEPDSTVCLVFASYGNKMIKRVVRKKRVIDGCLQLDKDIERIIKDVLEKDATKSFSFANLHQDRPKGE